MPSLRRGVNEPHKTKLDRVVSRSVSYPGVYFFPMAVGCGVRLFQFCFLRAEARLFGFWNDAVRMDAKYKIIPWEKFTKEERSRWRKAQKEGPQPSAL